MNVNIKITSNYGNEAIYILDGDFNAIHYNLTGKKTLSRGDIALYSKLGINFVVLAPTL